MSKPTIKTTDFDNVTIEALVKSVHAEQAGKTKADENSNKRRAIALQLAMAYPETLAQWKGHVTAFYSSDDKLKENARDWAAAVCGMQDEEKSNPDRRNAVAALMNSVTFAVDMISNGFHTDFKFGTKTLITGGSRLTVAAWRTLKWQDNKSASKDYSTDMTLAVVGKSTDKSAGNKISWAQLDDVSREIAGRKTQGRDVKQQVSAKKPLEALKIISSIVASDVTSHFKGDAARLQSINTAEDILALAFGTRLKEADDFFQRMREKAQTEAAAMLAAAKGNPDMAAKIAATLKAA